jgi:hypothetical protein
MKTCSSLREDKACLPYNKCSSVLLNTPNWLKHSGSRLSMLQDIRKHIWIALVYDSGEYLMYYLKLLSEFASYERFVTCSMCFRYVHYFW